MTNTLPSLFFILLFLIIPVIFSPNGEFVRLTEAGKGKVHITDDLDDVIDDEEDDAWKEWGKPKIAALEKFDPPKIDFDNMDVAQIQQEMMKYQFGPTFGFVKLRFGTRRTKGEVSEMATRWTKLLKTGGIQVKFTGIDFFTIMFNIQRGQDLSELKDYILNQPEAYEVKVGDSTFRRPGDPPLEQVLEKLQKEDNKEDIAKDDGDSKGEL